MLLRIALSAAAGVLFGLAFAPYGWWPLAFVAIAVLGASIVGRSPMAGALLGWCFGFAFLLMLMPWLQIIGSDMWFTLAAFEGLFYAAFGAALAWLSRLPWWPVLAGCAWVAMEWGRTSVPWGGFPWGRVPFAFGDSFMAAWSRYVGIAGLALIVVTVSLLVVQALRRHPRLVSLLNGSASGAAADKSSAPRRVAGLVTAIALVLVALALPTGLAGDDDETATVAAVQGSVPGSGLNPFAEERVVLQNHVRATHKLAAQVGAGERPQPDLVIWPENSTDIDPYRDQQANNAIASAVDAIGVPTLVGAVAVPPEREGLANLAIIWHPGKGPGATYAKRHLVPFGEYIPMRSWLEPRIGRLSMVGQDKVPGDDPGLMELGGVTVGTVICFEIAQDYVVRDVLAEGAQVLAVQTNNATYQNTGQMDQQWAISRLRAIETGRAVVVAATSGISGIVLPDGSVVGRVTGNEPRTFVADLPLGTGMTLGTRLGGWIEVLATLIAVAAIGAGIWRRRSEKRSEPEQSDRGRDPDLQRVRVSADAD